jgi:uncharacterized protein (UPF0332 family)
MTPDGLARARDEIAAARHLADAGFAAQAVSRAYYAAFYAAEAALLARGETRSKHSGVIAAFAQLLVQGGDIDESSGRLLRSLFERRSKADYDVADTPTADEAWAAVADAEHVVEAVAASLASQRD